MTLALSNDTATLTFDDVMSCRGRVVVVGPDRVPLAELAAGRLDELERRWSRFLPSSEISRLNRSGGATTTVGADTITLVEHLIDAHALTGGDFDPTLLRPIVELGYGTSRCDERHHTFIADGTAVRGSTVGIVVDRERGTITLPPGTALDPGGLGKGLAADLVADEMMRAGASGCLVELGGDLRVRGDAPGGHAWTIAVDGTDDEPPLLLAAGGVATSSTQRRTWQRDGRNHHHLLDPTTMQPTNRGVVECSVAVGTAANAEALTKVAFVRGLADGVGFYADRGIAARVVDADGSIVTTPAWRTLRGGPR